MHLDHLLNDLLNDLRLFGPLPRLRNFASPWSAFPAGSASSSPRGRVRSTVVAVLAVALAVAGLAITANSENRGVALGVPPASWVSQPPEWID